MTNMNIDLSGVNHITLACTDLPKSIAFYRNTLGATLKAEWPKGAYFEVGDLWLCLALEKQVIPRGDDTHVAFSCAESAFDYTADHIAETAKQWKSNTSEGASLYFLDPDGHKLELHAGSLQSRLAHYANTRPAGMRLHS